jgi:hypothetical protein
LNEDTVTDLSHCGYGNPQNLFWYAEEDDTGNENSEETAGDGTIAQNTKDTRIDMTKEKKQERQKQSRKQNVTVDRVYAKSQEKAHHMMHVHKTYCYSRFEESHSARRYLRGNFILTLVATIKLLASGIMITLGTFALDTDPLTILAFTGVAWTALWFQGGIVDLFRNYLYHFVILATDKFHPGNIVMLEGHTKEPGCVFAITPLYTVLMTKHADAAGRSEELLFEDVPNYNFFVYPMTTAYRWKKPIKRNKIVASASVTK